MSNLIDDLKNRLQTAIDCAGIKPIELSEKTGIPKSSISQYMSGYTKPNTERIYLISKVLNVSEAWLMGFDVPMERENLEQLTLSEQHHLASYRKLNTIGQSKVDAYIDGLLENSLYLKSDSSAKNAYSIAAFGGASKTGKLTKKDINELVDALEDPIE